MGAHDQGLGRRVPQDWKHRDLFPLRAVAPETVATVEHAIPLPQGLADIYYQNGFNGCVGASLSQLACIFNTTRRSRPRAYDWQWLWNEAKKSDGWDDTNPGDNNGTSVRAGFDVLRNLGHVRVVRGKDRPPDAGEGVEENRWALSVDEIRTAIAAGIPVAMGTDWYQGMSKPVKRGTESWIDLDHLGSIIGGHAYLLTHASDQRQAFWTPNTWGGGWPFADAPGLWLPYDFVGSLLLPQSGEAGIATDRIRQALASLGLTSDGIDRSTPPVRARPIAVGNAVARAPI